MFKSLFFQRSFPSSKESCYEIRKQATCSSAYVNNLVFKVSYAFRTPKNSGDAKKEQDVDAPSNLDVPEENISFVFGRSNIIKGKTDTVQDFSMAVRAKEIKKNLLRITANDPSTPLKSGSLGIFQGLSGQLPSPSRDESESSSNPSLNDSSEVGQLGFVEKPKEITNRMTRVANSGIINNPFTERSSYTEKQISARKNDRMLSVSKPSLVLFPSQFGLSTKSEEFFNINRNKG